jgi:branched-chain amino acid transport system substrate-binding protein
MKRSKLYKLLSAVLVILMIGIFVLAAGCSQQQQTPVDSEKTQPVEPEKNLESKEYILIGRVNPATGPLAGFGLGTPFIEDKAIEAVNAEGGIYIKEYDKKLPIKIIYADSESNPTKASEAASKLCLQDKVDIIIGSHTPETVSPVASSAERSGIPCVTVDAPGVAGRGVL